MRRADEGRFASGMIRHAWPRVCWKSPGAVAVLVRQLHSYGHGVTPMSAGIRVVGVDYVPSGSCTDSLCGFGFTLCILEPVNR